MTLRLKRKSRYVHCFLRSFFLLLDLYLWLLMLNTLNNCILNCGQIPSSAWRNGNRLLKNEIDGEEIITLNIHLQRWLENYTNYCLLANSSYQVFWMSIEWIDRSNTIMRTHRIIVLIDLHIISYIEWGFLPKSHCIMYMLIRLWWANRSIPCHHDNVFFVSDIFFFHRF